MKRWQQSLTFLLIFLLPGCGILKKTRQTNHHGVEMNDFGLPVISYASADRESRSLLLLFSGDGGWLDFEDQLAGSFAAEGFQTLGFNSRTYFWESRTPEQTAEAVSQLIIHYMASYKSRRIYLAGYSFGADVVPFIYNRLPAAVKSRVVSLELLSPFATSDFMVHTADLLNIAADDRPYKVRPEVEAVRIPVYCFYGEQENPRPMEQVEQKNFTLKLLPGDHHYDPSGYKEIVRAMHRARRNQLFRTFYESNRNYREGRPGSTEAAGSSAAGS